MVTINTDALRPQDRFEYFGSVILSSYGRNHLTVPDPVAFSGALRVVQLDRLRVSTIRCTPLAAQRVVEKSRTSAPEIAYLQITTEGRTHVAQGGRQTILNPGEMCLLDTTSTFTVEYSVTTAHLVLEIPRAELERRVGPIERLTGRAFSGPPGALAIGILRNAISKDRPSNPPAWGSIANQAIDAAAIAVTNGAPETVRHLHSAAAISRLRLHHAIEESLEGGVSRCEDVVGMAGISMRYANLLLAQEGTSLERLLIMRRLEKCRAMLADASLHRRHIGDIALAVGFESASHFARAFKSAYGVTARDYRLAALLHGSEALGQLSNFWPDGAAGTASAASWPAKCRSAAS